ncbi:universal stress protein [Streptomyces pristinaespiralis]|uniref:universal stress protein n=1 Tax=Streptomyces pristinaespiralis TaxID=38300 RepID=UPI00340F6620
MSTGTVGGPELGTVVVGVDGSEHARAAAQWAAAEADRRGRPLRILYGADLDRLTRLASMEAIEQIREAGRVLLLETAAVVQDRFPGLTVIRELSRKDPASGLRAAAGPSDTVVVGSRGLGGFRTLLLGSVGLEVAARCWVPVVVVRGEPDSADTGVVTAAVRGPADTDWLGYAAREAHLRKGELRVLSVWNPLIHAAGTATLLNGLDETAQEHGRRMKRLAEPLCDAFPGLTLTTEVSSGTSAAGLLVEASRHTDLLVLGARRRPVGLGPRLGHVAHALLHHAHSPVAIVPRGTGDSEED